MEKEFREYLKAKNLSEKSIKQYLKHLRLFGKECDEINSKQVNKFIGDHPTYVTRAFFVNLFDFLEAQGIEASKIPKIPKVTGRKKMLKKRIATDEEVKAIRHYIKKHNMEKYVLMYDISDRCALRREEICTIKKSSFEIDTWEKGKSMRLRVYAKGKERIVIVPPKLSMRVITYLIENIDKIPDDRFFAVGVRRWDEVFKSAVYKVCDRNITLHDLRRRRATKWLDQGVDLDEVRRRLGHSDISTTQKYLIREEEDRLKKWEEE